MNTKRENKCPPSKPDFNPIAKKCTVKCKDGKVRNEKFRCVNNKTRKSKSKSSSSEDKKNVEYFSKQKEKDERRALALRLNLKRRKSQLRKRVGKEDG